MYFKRILDRSISIDISLKFIHFAYFWVLITLIQMKGFKILKPQPSPKSSRTPLGNITNYFHSIPKDGKERVRSPSLSPRNGKRSIISREGKSSMEPREPFDTTQNLFSIRCINHKEKPGKFKIDDDGSFSHFCEDCALQLTYEGKKVILVQKEEQSLKMVLEAREYVKICDEVLRVVSQRMHNCEVERNRAELSIMKMREDIQQERKETIKKINLQYERQIQQCEERIARSLQILEEQIFKLSESMRQFKTVRDDVLSNMKEMNGGIKQSQFREIMDIYWAKISHFNEVSRKNKSSPRTISESSRAFIQKYIPPTGPCEQKENKGIGFGNAGKSKNQSKPIGKEFTFNKNMWNLGQAKGTFSWEGDETVHDSGESVVQQRVILR